MLTAPMGLVDNYSKHSYCASSQGILLNQGGKKTVILYRKYNLMSPTPLAIPPTELGADMASVMLCVIPAQ